MSAWRPVIFVTASLVIFGLSIEQLGLVVSILLLIGVGAVAARELRPVETVAVSRGEVHPPTMTTKLITAATVRLKADTTINR